MPQPTSSAPFRISAVLIAIAIVAALYFARDVLIPIAMAALLTFLLAPIVRRLERLRVPRVAAVVVVVASSILVLGGVVWALESQLLQLAARLPEYKDNIIKKLDSLRVSEHSPLAQAEQTIRELGNALATNGDGQPPSTDTSTLPPPAPHLSTSTSPPAPSSPPDAETEPLSYAQLVIMSVLEPLKTAGIIIIFTFFMLLKREDLRNRFIRLVGQHEMHVTTQALIDAGDRVNRFLVAQLVTNLTAGTAITIGLVALGVPSALFWGILVVLLRFIPYIGMWIAAVLPLALSVAVSPSWTEPLLILGLFAIVELICGNFLEPTLTGSGAGISAVAILVAAVFWGWLWGVVGLLLATPLTVCLAVIGRHVPHLEFLDVLLGAEPVLTPEARLYQRLLARDQEEADRIVESFAHEKPLLDVYESLVLPVARRAELDRHRGDIDAEHEAYIVETLDTIVEDLSGRALSAGATASSTAQSTTPAANEPHGKLVLCLPARDPADQLAARLLADLIAASGIPSDVLSSLAFSGELIEAVVERKPALVCISLVPPASLISARALYKRLRAKMPELPIVIGFWDERIDRERAQKRLGIAEQDRVVLTLSEALNVVRAVVPPMAKEEKPAPAVDIKPTAPRAVA